MSEKPIKGTKLKLERVVDGPSPMPKPAQKFDYVRVGPDVYLEVGHFDLHELRRAILHVKAGEEEAKEPQVPLYVTDRFVLTATGAVDLYRTALRLFQDMKREGLIPEDLDITDLEPPGEEVVSK